MSTVIDGSASVTINSGAVLGITSGTAVASTSGTAILFSSIPSWVNRVTVMFSGVSTSGASNLLIQLGSGSVTTTGYVSGAQLQSGTGVNFTNSTAGFVLYFGSAAYLGYGSMSFSRITGNTWVGSGYFNTSTTTATPSAGGVTLSGALDRVNITTVNGTDTFDAGTINILYE
jgi:hypothetical protein